MAFIHRSNVNNENHLQHKETFNTKMSKGEDIHKNVMNDEP
jgi:hypothetical protein